MGRHELEPPVSTSQAHSTPPGSRRGHEGRISNVAGHLATDSVPALPVLSTAEGSIAEGSALAGGRPEEAESKRASEFDIRAASYISVPGGMTAPLGMTVTPSRIQ